MWLWRTIVALGLGGSCLLASAAGQSLGKSTAYFYDRYGSQISSKTVYDHALTMPFTPSIVKLDRPHILRRYKRGKLTVETLYNDPALTATWARFTLTHDWTDEQLSAALASYGSNWKLLAGENLAEVVGGIVGFRGVYRSEEGVYAYHVPIGNQLMLYSPDVIARYKAYAAEQERAKAQVPRF